ncbi:hypothetical protein [Pseudodesulfovibrio piezophilus]|nr:hypothetical protein [Pseudodesulfovibrio piezophilus]
MKKTITMIRVHPDMVVFQIKIDPSISLAAYEQRVCQRKQERIVFDIFLG